MNQEFQKIFVLNYLSDNFWNKSLLNEVYRILSKKYEKGVERLSESEIYDRRNYEGTIFVIEPFDGEIFRYLNKFTSHIFGSFIVKYLDVRNELRLFHQPIYSYCLTNSILYCNTLPLHQMMVVENKIKKLNGKISLILNESVDYCLGNDVRKINYEVIGKMKNPSKIMKVDWLDYLLWKSKDDLVNMEENCDRFILRLFYGLKFFISSNFSLDEKNNWEERIEKNGGIVIKTFCLGEMTHYLTNGIEDIQSEEAMRNDVMIILPYWIDECEKKGFYLNNKIEMKIIEEKNEDDKENLKLLNVEQDFKILMPKIDTTMLIVSNKDNLDETRENKRKSSKTSIKKRKISRRSSNWNKSIENVEPIMECNSIECDDDIELKVIEEEEKIEFPKNLKNVQQKRSEMLNDENMMENVQLFDHITFMSNYIEDDDLRSLIEKEVEECGGKIVKNHADVVLFPTVLWTKLNVKKMEKVENLKESLVKSVCWFCCCRESMEIIECDEKNLYLQFQPFFTPIKLHHVPNKKLFNTFVITCTKYSSIYRHEIMNLIGNFGGEFQGALCRSKKAEYKACTHLLSEDMLGSKCDAANRWKMPIISSLWIYYAIMINNLDHSDMFQLTEYTDNKKIYQHLLEEISKIPQ